ncbi:hypothetical protein M405DRAFT_555311 [Rhizopogon salebrosus TDB-379]|nr:hypothetical protein M405DRAFT_555311 [Rhizopogon salebrosus TDB-379]
MDALWDIIYLSGEASYNPYGSRKRWFGKCAYRWFRESTSHGLWSGNSRRGGRVAVDHDNQRPTFKSDIYSFGGIMFFIVSGDMPWKEKKSYQISIELSRRVAHARPENIFDDHWNLIEECWSWDRADRPDATTVLTNDCWSTYASTCPPALTADLESEVDPSTDDVIPVSGVEASRHRPSSLDGFDVEQTTAPDYNIRPIQLDPGRLTRHQLSLVSSNTITLHPSSGVSRPPLLHVLIFGETRVGKSSIINLIMGKNVADKSPDAPRSVLKYAPYELNLGDRQFRFWEVPSIASMGFFQRICAKWQLKKSYKNLHRGDEVYLLLYCIRGPSIPSVLPRDYKYFTSIVGTRVPIALVVNGLEGSLNTMDNWWKKNKRGLERVGMHFSKHVCITSLPDHPDTSRSREAVRSLVCDRQTQ